MLILKIQNNIIIINIILIILITLTIIILKIKITLNKTKCQKPYSKKELIPQQSHNPNNILNLQIIHITTTMKTLKREEDLREAVLIIIIAIWLIIKVVCFKVEVYFLV